MRNIGYKISMIFLIVVLSILGWTNVSNGGWEDAKKGDWDGVNGFPSFKYYSNPANMWNSGRYQRRYTSSGYYLIEDDVHRISNPKDTNKWTLKWSGKKKPIINKTWGVICVEHSKQVDDTIDEEDINQDDDSTWPHISGNIVVDGHTVYRNYETNNQSTFSKGRELEAGRIYSYITTYAQEEGPGPGQVGNRRAPVQKAIWATCGTYLGSDLSSFASLSGWIEDNEDEANSGITKKIKERALDYAAMKPLQCTLTSDKTVYKMAPGDSSKYIIGPFRANFSSDIGSNSGLRFSGEFNSTVNGETKNGGRWTFCNASGKEISINGYNKEKAFYIKVDTSLLGKNNGKARLQLKVRALKVGAEWWELLTSSGKQGQIMVTSSVRMWDQKSATAEMEPPTLTIKKEDYHTAQPLAGMQFKIRTSYGYYTGKDKYGFPIYGSSSQAKIFTSHNDGKLDTIMIDVGTCWIEEVSVGSNLQYQPGGTYQVKVSAGHNNPVIKNTKIYVNLSGYVWEDIPWQDKNEFVANGLYNTGGRDTNDKLLANVTVRLMQNGRIVAEVETDSNGKYLIQNVRIDDLDKNYIEFIYNGMSFGSVKPTLGDGEKGSKASEQMQGTLGNNYRTAFNSNYATIVPNQALRENGQRAYSISYHQKDYQSNVNFGAGAKYGYSGQEVPINKTESQYLIQANTLNAYNGYLDKIKTPEQIRKEGLNEIKNINLGVERREQPDLSTIKDIHYASVHINNAHHIYNYSDRFKNEYYGDKESNGHSMEPRVKFDVGSKYGSVSYTRELYPSDVYYSQGDKKEQLRVQVTYKIAIFNGASARQDDKKITSIVNELEDYYDTKYEIDKTKINIGKSFDAKTGEIKENIDFDTIDTTGTNDYFKLKIRNMNMAIEQGQEKCIYVQLEVQQDKIHEIVEQNEGKDDNQAVKLDNVVEITSYSTKDANGNTYAGIDKDSQPGNLKIEDKKTYEDDTDKAPGLKLVLQEERRTEGIVFMDEPEEGEEFNSDVVNTAQIRQGNGKYDQGEKTIDGVTVQMVNLATGNIAQIYNKDTHTWEEAQTVTKDGGKYSFEGFIPEKYKIVYTWGGDHKVGEETKKIRVQDYKATIYNDKERQENEEWYKIKEDEQNSDAMDDYVLRQEIDKQTNLITHANKQIIENYQGELKVENNANEIIKQMNSTTPDFRVFVEYSDASPSDGKELHQVTLKNIDFGIIERAKQALELEKEIKRVTITLSNGNVLIDAQVGEDANGKKKLINDVKHTIYMPKTEINNGITKTRLNAGQLKVEIDNEIVQGSRLEIEYDFKVNNISELDYINQEYYHYGDKQGYQINNDDLVKLRADTVIDYLDNKISNNAEEGGNNNWIAYDNAEKGKLIENGFLSEKLEKTIKTTNTIMHTEQLAEDLQPTGKTNVTIPMTTYKILPSILQDEDSTVENDAEIIQITKNGGSTLTITPGNYEPSEGVKEVDDAQSEEVVIVPPTGLTTDYIGYTLFVISSLGILVAGIILIKKLVMSR